MKHLNLFFFPFILLTTLIISLPKSGKAQSSSPDDFKLWVEAYVHVQTKIHLNNISFIMESGLSERQAEEDACEILKAVIDIREHDDEIGAEPWRRSRAQTVAMKVVYSIFCEPTEEQESSEAPAQ